MAKPFRLVSMATGGTGRLADSPPSAKLVARVAQAQVGIHANRLRYAARRTVGDLANEWLEAGGPKPQCRTPVGRRACAVDSYEAPSDLAAVADEPDEHRARLQELIRCRRATPVARTRGRDSAP